MNGEPTSPVSESAAPAAATTSSATAMWSCLAVAWVLFLTPIPFLCVFGIVPALTSVVLAIIALAKGRTKIGLLGLFAAIVGSALVLLIGVAMAGAVLKRGWG